MHAVGNRTAGVLVHHGGVREIHEHRPSAGSVVAHRLAGLAEAAFEIRGDRHLQFTQPQLQAHICTLFARCGVDGTHQTTVRRCGHGLHHLSTHPPQCSSHHHGDGLSGRCAGGHGVKATGRAYGCPAPSL